MGRTRLLTCLVLTAVAITAGLLWSEWAAPRPTTIGAQAAVSSPAIARRLLPQQDESPPAAPSALGRLVISAIGVDAPIAVAGRDEQGRMAAPRGPAEVTWYDFTSWPGQPGNAVLAGHLNWRDGSAGVFSHLADL